MALVQDEYGEWYDDGAYVPDDGVYLPAPIYEAPEPELTPPPIDDSEPGYDTFPTPTPAPAGDGSDADAAAGLIPEAELMKLTGGKSYADFMKSAMTPEAKTAIQDLIKSYGTGAWATAKKLFTKADGTLNLPALGAIGGGLLGAIGALNPNTKKVGYQGGLKDLVAQRTMATAPVAGRRPGAGGTNYGGDVQYTERSANAPAPAAPVQTVQADTTPATNPWAGKMNRGFAKPVDSGIMAAAPAPTASEPSYDPYMNMPDIQNEQRLMAENAQNSMIRNSKVGFAHGGLMGLAHGGRYLQGDTDGMADKLRTSIDGKQPAALSHGEFVVPADVVSHLGNGNSDAGAKKLYSMMDKIRQARTGTKKQGKQINPDKFMPGGLAAAYAAGGSVHGFADGGITGVPSGTTGVEQTLAGWTGSYAPNMLAKTEALANAPMPQYSGPLTAGASDLQNQAFAGASENAAAGYDPTKFTSGTFNTQSAQQYMNPYLQAALDPQIAEARRQSEITAQQNNAAMTKAGAFGGGRQAILTAENQRNLGTNLAGIVGTGYNTAFTNAQNQFNTEQNRALDTQKASEASRQYGADYGLKALNQLGDMGAVQRGITSEGIAADKKAFEEARNAPYEQLKFQSQMLNGLPISATNYETALPSTAQQVLSGAGGVAGLLGNKTNYTMDDVTAAMRKLGFNV